MEALASALLHFIALSMLWRGALVSYDELFEVRVCVVLLIRSLLLVHGI